MSLEPSLLHAEQPQLSLPSDHLCGLLWTRSNRSMSLLCWGLQSWMQDCRWDLQSSVEGRITFLDLLDTSGAGIKLLSHPTASSGAGMWCCVVMAKWVHCAFATPWSSERVSGVKLVLLVVLWNCCHLCSHERRDGICSSSVNLRNL